MHSFITLFTLLLLPLPFTVSAGPHGSRVRRVYRRHHGRSHAAGQQRRDTGCDDDPATTCTVGAWQCMGTELQRCWDDEWHVVQNCTASNQVCSAESGTTGCVWVWSLNTQPPKEGSPANLSLITGSGTDDSTPATSAVSAAQPSSSATITTSNSTTLYANGTTLNANGTTLYANGTSTDENDENGDDDGNDCGDNDDDNSSASITSSFIIPASTASITAGNLYAGQSGFYGNLTASITMSSTSGPVPSAAGNASATYVGKVINTTSSTDLGGTISVTSFASSSSSRHHHKNGSATGTATASSPSAIVTANTTLNIEGTTTVSPSASSATASASTTSNNSTTTATPAGSFSAPHYVIYADNWLSSMPSADAIGSYNRFILAFWMSDVGPVDDAQAWQQFDASTRESVLKEYHDAGIALMVSAFGSTDSPTSNGADPTSTASQLAQFVIDYGLDGVDIDYEDMSAMNSNQAESWIVTFQTELRTLLPSPYIISHAPVAPWFTSASDYASGAYVNIHQAVGHTIDFYNIQFYNQGDGVYTDCTSLITDSGDSWPSTSVMEINSYAGVPLEKIVIGKPLDTSAADNGFMSMSTLGECVAQARTLGWNAGVMFWEWTNEAPSLMATVMTG